MCNAALASMKRGNLTPKDILLYDVRSAVLEILPRDFDRIVSALFDPSTTTTTTSPSDNASTEADGFRA
ncbi:hypothetical protein DFJ73DRAFT_795814 [Zopfochytrium polystomum]|nr:hypothetical protein DFJ73DRAFT_795814 [Zopfochytrium polystomum]